MPEQIEIPDLGGNPFRIGEWLVEPSLNRVSRGDTTIQLELKVMDVLVCLAERAGEVVTRIEIIDRVWATEFIADNTLTHAINEIRTALGDDARNPTFIETIHRRGYRLMVPVELEEPQSGTVAQFPSRARAVCDNERSPYPGLAAFTEDDAEFFFGRESEVAQLWRKITTRRLLAVIGPSGVGKSSFLRAGLIPAAPEGWGILICQPGEAPFAALARALLPEFRDDPEALSKATEFEANATSLFTRWRERHDRALLIVDQFEELFTLNPPETQGRFAGLLRRLVDEAGVHVLLSMRDDFLCRCHDHEPLAPIFDSLTPVRSPDAGALRRALVEPAKGQGFAFEDDALAAEMVSEIHGERGALPLLAFAVARLWEKRDREGRILTHQAFADIGRVSGALARHAEATLKAIGDDRLPLAREIFRNLVTAEGTRAVREAEELLSVFAEPGRADASVVLQRLIDARLLTSFEEEAEEGKPGLHRVEVVHESLLTSWPRLVRWQTQDQEGAQLRDELRQAARAWDEHGRHDDRLWTGTAFREYQLWRERYPGGLTDSEEAFCSAMTVLAGRRRRRRRIAVAAGFSILLAGLTIVGTFWQRSVREALRAEAAELVVLGQLELEEYPTAAVAHTIASLELADSPAAKLLALEALWKGPTAMVVGEKHATNLRFTSDGRWLVHSYFDRGDGPLLLIGADGSSELLPETHGHEGIYQERDAESGFFALYDWDTERVGTGKMRRERVTLWSAPESRMLGEVQIEGHGVWGVVTSSDDGRVVILVFEGEGRFSVDTLSFDGTHERLGTREFDVQSDESSWFVSLNIRTGRWIVSSTGHDIYVTEIGEHGMSEPQHLGRQRDLVSGLCMDPLGRFVATADAEGRIRLWNMTGTSPPEIIQGPPGGGIMRISDDGSFLSSFWRPPKGDLEPVGEMEYWIWSIGAERPELLRRMEVGNRELNTWTYLDPVGRQFVRTGGDLKIRLWPMSAPADAEPLYLLRGEVGGQVFLPAFHPTGHWLAVADRSGLALWPLAKPYPAVIRRHKGAVGGLVFGPKGQWLASSSEDGTVKLWPLEGEVPAPGRVLFDAPTDDWMESLARSPAGDRLLVGTGENGVLLISVGDEPPRTLLESSGWYTNVAFSPDGRLAAASSAKNALAQRKIGVWDVASGEQVGLLAEGESRIRANPQFIGDGHLMALDRSGLRRWDINTGESELLYEGSIYGYAVTADGRRALLLEAPTSDDPGRAIALDIETGVAMPLASHGDHVSFVMLDAAGNIAVTGDNDGTIRVGPVTGEEPHLLLGHEHTVRALAIDPLGRWIASGSEDTTVRLWPMPDLSKPPLHTLPRDELIAKLKTLTNLRVVRDEESSTGWKIEVGPFPGWETVPTW